MSISKSLRQTAAAVATVGLAVGLGVAGTSAAEARPTSAVGFIYTGAAVRYDHGTQYQVAWYSVGSNVYLDCWLDAQEPNGSWYRWYRLSGTYRWVRTIDVSPNPLPLPHC